MYQDLPERSTNVVFFHDPDMSCCNGQLLELISKHKSPKHQQADYPLACPSELSKSDNYCHCQSTDRKTANIFKALAKAGSLIIFQLPLKFRCKSFPKTCLCLSDSFHTDPEAVIGFSKCPKRSEGGAFHLGQIPDKI